MSRPAPQPEDFVDCLECGQLFCLADTRDFDRDREGRALGVDVCWRCGRIVGGATRFHHAVNRSIDWIYRLRRRTAQREAAKGAHRG